MYPRKYLINLSHLILLSVFVMLIVQKVNAGDGKLKNSRVLVYTKNGKGYVHDNIPSAVACVKELAVANGFSADVSDDPA